MSKKGYKEWKAVHGQQCLVTIEPFTMTEDVDLPVRSRTGWSGGRVPPRLSFFEDALYAADYDD